MPLTEWNVRDGSDSFVVRMTTVLNLHGNRRHMRYGPAIAILVLMLTFCPLMADDVVADGDVESQITIRGFVGDISTSGNMALNDVNVRLLGPNMTVTNECMTGSGDLEAGEFIFTYAPGTGAYLSFECEGYTARTWPEWMVQVPNQPNMFSFSLNNLTPGEDGVYNITSTLERGSFIAMSITTAYISGYVTDAEGDPIMGATVTITSADGEILRGSTNSSGYYRISCYYGTYTIQASCNGFKDSEPDTILTNNTTYTIVLSEKDTSMIWGLNAPHAMELMGVLCVAIVFIILAMVYRKSQSGESETVFVNDLKEDDDLKES